MEMAPHVVERVAREVVGDARASLLDWSIEALGGGVASEFGSTAIRRVRGSVASASGPVDWSVVLKMLHPGDDEVGDQKRVRDDPRGWAYWRREADLYGSGLLGDLGEGLRAPACYRIEDVRGGDIALWLEDIPDGGPAAWPLERFELAARHLGRFNGRHLGRDPSDDPAWLSRGRVRDWLALGERGLAAMRSERTGFVATWLTDESVARTRRLWEERERLIAALEALPRTLCHHDAHRRNLGSCRSAGGDETVAFDWEIFGSGHLGEEVAPMVVVALQLLDVPMARARDLEDAVLEGYVSGLRDAGWSGDRETVRLGYTITASLFMGVGGAGAWFMSLANEDGAATAERILGRPVSEIAHQWSRLQPYLLDLGDEALRRIA